MSQPRPLIWLPLRDVVRVEGANILVDGNMESLVVTPPWNVVQAVVTKDTNTPHAGLRCLKIAFDGVNAVGLAYQGGMIVGGLYHAGGYFAGDGTAGVPRFEDGAGGGLTIGTLSAAWQPYDIQWTATAATAHFRSDNLALNRFVRFDDCFINPLNAYTKNKGSLGDVLVGDGITPATMPTMLTPSVNVRRGMNFASQYLQLVNTITSGTYSMMAVVTHDALGNAFLIDARASGGTGWLQVDGGTTLAASSGTIYVGGQPSVTLPVGRLTTVAVAGISLEVTAKMVLGASNSLFLPWAGKMFEFCLFSGTWSPQQVAMLHENMMSQLSI